MRKSSENVAEGDKSNNKTIDLSDIQFEIFQEKKKVLFKEFDAKRFSIDSGSAAIKLNKKTQ